MQRSGPQAVLDLVRAIAVAEVDELAASSRPNFVDPRSRADILVSRYAAITREASAGLGPAPNEFEGAQQRYQHLSSIEKGVVDDWVTRALRSSGLSLSSLWAAQTRNLEMPMLDEIGRLGQRQGVDLADCLLVGVQHLLGSSVPVFQWLNALGLPYERMFVAGKVYSANALVEWKLTSLGVNVFAAQECAPSSAISDEVELAQLVAKMLAEVMPRLSDGQRLLVLDDGGLTVSELVSRWPEFAPRAVAMEQTRRGTNILRSLSRGVLSCPVVNVAESAPKLKLEADVIGESIVRSIDDRLSGAACSWNDSREIVVVGYGSVGTGVARALRRRGIVPRIFDTNRKRMKAAALDGFRSSRTLDVSGAWLVIGCTGIGWFGPSQWEQLRGTVLLASGSSADVEFGPRAAQNLYRVQLSACVERLGQSAMLCAHSNYSLLSNQGQQVINGGFPCNFDGTVDPVPPKAIQLTRALILAGACSAALLRSKRGLIALPERTQRLISASFADVAEPW